MSDQTAAGWYEDPFRRHEHRYWDGSRWTEHVGSQGRQFVDAPAAAPPARLVDHQVPAAPARVHDRKAQRQVEKLGVGDPDQSGGGTLFTEQILVINQKAKLFERRAEYSVFDQNGRKVGGVREFGFNGSRFLVGRENSTKRLQIVGADGIPVLVLTRPATVLKSKVTVSGTDGTPVGVIAQENFGVMGSVFGGRFNIRFRMEADGETVGSIHAESWRAWDFRIEDRSGAEIGRVTKTWAGFAREGFTKADHYVLEMHQPLRDPLLSLVVSAALVVDTVLKQGDDRSR